MKFIYYDNEVYPVQDYGDGYYDGTWYCGRYFHGFVRKYRVELVTQGDNRLRSVGKMRKLKFYLQWLFL